MKLRPLLLLCIFILLAFIPWSAFYNAAFDLSAMNALPSWQHPLGTDNLGRDLLVRMSEAIRETILPLWFVVILSSVVGITLAVGCLGYLGETKLAPLMGFFRGLNLFVGGIPVGISVFLIVAVAQTYGAGSSASFFAMSLSLGLLVFIRSFGTIREQFLRDENLGYWQMHTALGGHMKERLWQYGIRGEWRLALIQTLGFHLRMAVTIEASLSYLGFGVQEPKASLGNILAAHLDAFLKGYWWIPFLVATVLALTAAVPGAFSQLAQGLTSRHSRHS